MHIDEGGGGVNTEEVIKFTANVEIVTCTTNGANGRSTGTIQLTQGRIMYVRVQSTIHDRSSYVCVDMYE